MRNLDRLMRRYKGFLEFCDAARAESKVFFRDYACESNQLTFSHLLSMTANVSPGRFWYSSPPFSWAVAPNGGDGRSPFSVLVESLVFRGMRPAARIHRSLSLRADLEALFATPHQVDTSGHVAHSSPPPPQSDGAAGGVIASAMDLGRFDVALSNGRLLTPEWQAVLWTPARTPAGAGLPYRLGCYRARVSDSGR